MRAILERPVVHATCRDFRRWRKGHSRFRNRVRFLTPPAPHPADSPWLTFIVCATGMVVGTALAIATLLGVRP